MFFKRMQLKMIYIVFFSQFLFLFSFGTLGGLPLNVPFLMIILYYIVSLCGILRGEISLNIKLVFLYLLICLVFTLSSILNKFSLNISSLLLHFIYFGILAILDKNHEGIKFNECLKTFVIISTLAGLFGIYQYIAYNFAPFLPLKEIIPKQFWSVGYNTLQQTHSTILGGRIIKPHSIYAEASNLSKYSAIAISLMLFKNFRPKHYIIPLIINFTAMVLSLSGSGFIILFVCLVYKFFNSNRRYKLIFSISTIIMLIVLRFYYDSEFLSYYLGRTDEFTTANTSGYYRFVLPFIIGLEGIENYFFGYGVGNDEFAMKLYGALEPSISNGFGKMFVENGIIGLILLIILFVYAILPRKDNKKITVFSLIVIVLNISGSYMTPIFWTNALLIAATKNTKLELD